MTADTYICKCSLKRSREMFWRPGLGLLVLLSERTFGGAHMPFAVDEVWIRRRLSAYEESL